MRKASRMAITATAIGIATLSVGAPAHAGSSDIGAGLVGFGIGAILGSMMGPPEVYFVPPAKGFLRAGSILPERKCKLPV